MWRTTHSVNLTRRNLVNARIMRYSFLLIFFFIFFAFDAYARTPVLNTDPSLYLVSGFFHLEGIADPEARIELEFSKIGARSLRRFINAEKGGKWIFNEKLALAEGEWMVRARARESDGGNSEWSDTAIFQSIVHARGMSFLFWVSIGGGAFVLFFVLKLARYFRKSAPSKEINEKEALDSVFAQNTIIPPTSFSVTAQNNDVIKRTLTIKKIDDSFSSETTRIQKAADFEQRPFIRRFYASAPKTNDVEEKK